MRADSFRARSARSRGERHSFALGSKLGVRSFVPVLARSLTDLKLNSAALTTIAGTAGDFDVYERFGVEAVVSCRRNDAQRVVFGTTSLATSRCRRK